MEAHSLARSGGGLTFSRSPRLLARLGDERLVEQLRRGNEAAFEVLYDRHHRGVLSYCRHMLGSRDEAEDAVQQAFVSAHAGIVASDKPIRFKAWIYTIARNRCLSMLRARREQPTDDLDYIETAGLGELVQQRADLQELLGDLHELPDDQRSALVLSEVGDLSHVEVAEVIGCEAAKVKSLVFQARSGLLERRKARETPCEEIREQLATLRGGSLRRGSLRRHVQACPGCAEFRDEVRRQRQMLAVVLPVFPTLGLKESALAAVGAGTASAGGVVAGGTGLGGALVAKAGAAKVVVAVVAAGGAAAGGGVALERTVLGGEDGPPPVVQPQFASGTGVLGAVQTDDSSVVGAGEEESGRERNESAPGQVGKDAGERGGGRDKDNPGFEPVRGESNGERAREFARSRGRGRHRGLERDRAARGGADRRNPSAGARRQNGARGGGQPQSRPDRLSSDRSGSGRSGSGTGGSGTTPRVRPEPRVVTPPTRTVPESTPEVPAPQVEVPRLPSRGKSGGKPGLAG